MKKLILGMGITGCAVARFLAGRGEAFACFDDRKDAAAVSAELGFAVEVYGDPEAPRLAEYDAVILSPGPRPDHPLLVRARAAGLAVVPEVEYAFGLLQGKVVGITGSNGKSTTTSLIHHLLVRNGLPARLCGNIGVPLIACLDDDGPDRIYVLELSSFQLAHVRSFRPFVGVLLNISPDHLDWHGGFAGYEAAKLRLFACQEADDLAVVPPEYAERIGGAAGKVVVPSEAAHETEDALVLGDGFRLPLDAIPILGKHNRGNVLFACAAVQRLGLNAAQVARGLADFQGLEHRMEQVGTWEGRLWINDSKATNVHAAQAAVDALDRPYVLILGGCDKGERFDRLQLAANPPRAVVAYGETALTIIEDLKPVEVVHRHLFRDAVAFAHEQAGIGGAVLLAPACASFDQFENFGMRGKVFKQLFQERSGMS